MKWIIMNNGRFLSSKTLLKNKCSEEPVILLQLHLKRQFISLESFSDPKHALFSFPKMNGPRTAGRYVGDIFTCIDLLLWIESSTSQRQGERRKRRSGGVLGRGRVKACYSTISQETPICFLLKKHDIFLLGNIMSSALETS